jgi:hypothetical protein
VPPAPRPQWQQATALITIGAGSIATGLAFVPKAAADLTTPASIPPVTLLALEHANAPAPGRDAMLRAAIVHMARHFLRLAQTRSPAEMEAMIWQYASTDGASHGPSCGAFASLTLELGSHIAGVDSWVTGGTSYPWPVHSWADGRVDPNPASPGVVSILQDARSHGRWHPLGDGYTPQPGDWVLFDGHVEVVTKHHGGVLHTIGGDSLPNLSVNAHEYADPLHDQGVAGFVDNGVGMSKAPSGAAHTGGGGKHGVRAAASRGNREAAPPMASAAPSLSDGRASSAGPASGTAASNGRARGGAAASGAARGGASSDGAARGGATSGGVAPGASPGRAAPGAAAGAAAPSAGPVTTAAATAQQPEFAPRAIPAPRPAGQRPQHGDRRPQGPDRGPQNGHRNPQHADRRSAMTADVPATGLRPARPHHARPGQAAIPGLFKGPHRHHPGAGGALAPYHRHDVPPSDAPLPGTATQQAFIKQVASGAMATQRRYGVPASVTIAQAIDESGWGQSLLATSDHNLFGIKGTGPAGSDQQPTQEVINGQLVNLPASFQIYQDIAQSIDAHGRLLAHSGDYADAMARSKDPDAFAAALTGIYATDPSYGAKLIQLMKQYDLYRFDRAAPHSDASGAGNGGGTSGTHHPARGARRTSAPQPGGAQHPGRAPLPPPSPEPRRPSPSRDRTPDPKHPGPIGNPVPVQPAPTAEPVPGQPAPIANPVPVEPGPMTGPRGTAHHPGPARGTKTGAGAAAHQAGTPRAGQAGDHTREVHHDAVPPPTAVLYPGRSARPAPLAHPARPADLARPADPVPSRDPGATSARTQAQQPGPWPGPGTGQGSGTGFGTEPSSGTGPTSGQANIAADAAIPGVPHAVTPHPAGPHARGPIGRLRPAHPAGRRTLPASRAQHAGPAAPGNAVGGNAGGQPGAAQTVPPANSGPDRPDAPHLTVPAASTPTVSQAGGTMIPGFQHHGLGAHGAAGVPAGAAAPDGTPTATAQPGGSSIPGAQQGGMAGSSAATPGPAAAASSQAPNGPAAYVNGGPADSGPTQAGSFQVPAESPASGPAQSAAATLTVYHTHMPPSVRQAFLTSAKLPLVRAEPLYRDVASHTGIRWEILAACDWMQCKAQHGYSPVYGEKLGALNPDDTCYRTKSAALEQCASDLVQLARSVYQIDIATGHELSVRDLANVFAAYRWGGLLRQHCTSAMDFPYSVAGLTADHVHMRWPNIDEPNAPDKPGSRFRQPFGAVPVVLSLNYQALM